jgi:hypothetical protein
MDLEQKKRFKIYIVSDSIGETAELVVRAGISQFSANSFEIKRMPYVNDRKFIDTILDTAAKKPSMLVYTLLDSDLRIYLAEKALEKNIEAIDLMGSLLNSLSAITGVEPKMEPGKIHRLDAEYFQRIEAIEFAVKFDDGKDPRGLFKADIALVGVSRTSKTPISMYLANRGYKVANIPLVPEVTPPKELYEISNRKMVGLTINPEELFSIRQTRLKVLGLPNQADYANLDRILSELDFAEALMRKFKCPIINVTKKAIEETANEIIDCIKKRRETTND